MAWTIPVHMVQQYTTNVESLLQQAGGKLTGLVSRGSYTGKAVKFIEQFGPITPSRDLPRHADTPLMNPTDDARWVAPHDHDAGILIDSQDKLRMLIDPKSGYTVNMVEGMRRAQDDEILLAFFATALTGENGTTTTPYSSSYDVPLNTGGTASGLNVAKLRYLKRLMIANGINVEAETGYIIIDSTAHDELLNEIQVISLDFNSKPVLVDGKVTSFMGFQFKIMEFLSAADYPYSTAAEANSDADEAFLPAWVPSGMHFGDWNMLDIDVGPRRDKRNAQQIYMTQTVGASRVQEKKVFRIRCARS